MKFQVSFKTPDTMADSINQAVSEMGLNNEEERHHLTMKLAELAENYIQYGEFVTLEFDTYSSSVTVKQCRKCLLLTPHEITEWLSDRQGWDLTDGALIKQYNFSDFNRAMSFAISVGMYAERVNHHPVLEVSWGRVKVIWKTDDAGGVTINDLAGADHCDAFSMNM
jgi:4a-hydroxytetrahydrobiopterin dehydratase